MPDPRIHPLLAVSRDDLAQLVGAELASVEPVDGGLTNTVHRVVTAHGDVLAVKHHAAGVAAWRDELAVLRALAGRLPVPDIVHAAERRAAIVYRWIDGITLDDCRRREPAAFASLAAPLGHLLATLAQTAPPGGTSPATVAPPPTNVVAAGASLGPTTTSVAPTATLGPIVATGVSHTATDIASATARDVGSSAAALVAPMLAQARAQLAAGRARNRLGGPLAEALTGALEAWGARIAWGATCLGHNDLGGRNVLVAREGERWQIAGVLDWEAAGPCSPLVDLGSLFRYSQRYDTAFREAFERAYRDAGGALPEGWWPSARLLDATGMIDVLDENRELPGVFADCRMLLARLVGDLGPRPW